MSGRSRRGWRLLLRPGILLPLLLSAALLAFAFSISNLPQVIDRVGEISFTTIALGFGLAVAYLVLKCIEFNLLLTRLGIRLSWRRVIFAYAVAEMTIAIPAGVYVQNYILGRMRSAGFARSSAATTVGLIIELVVVLLMLALLGVPTWTWVRPTALAVLGGLVLFLGILLTTDILPGRLVPWLRRIGLESLPRALADMTKGLRQLATPRTVIPAMLLAAVYLSALAAAFMVIGRGTGAPRFSYTEAVTVYAFSLAVTLLMAGILTQLGVIEVAGLGAAMTFGYGPSAALAMMIGFRVVWLGSIWLASGPTAWLLRDVLHDTEPADGEQVDPAMRSSA
ncbi:MAG: lysylphosphatidylglycerol synthase domain-containing protein [Gemmatimonadota bacterium]|jgi:uncharacterized membrane protein YbhN (UPF0104 family)